MGISFTKNCFRHYPTLDPRRFPPLTTDDRNATKALAKVTDRNKRTRIWNSNISSFPASHQVVISCHDSGAPWNKPPLRGADTEFLNHSSAFFHKEPSSSPNERRASAQRYRRPQLFSFLFFSIRFVTWYSCTRLQRQWSKQHGC